MFYWCNFGVLAKLSTNIKNKNRLKISLGSANLQEHYSTILQVQNIACVAVMAINCMLFMTRNNNSLNNDVQPESRMHSGFFQTIHHLVVRHQLRAHLLFLPLFNILLRKLLFHKSLLVKNFNNFL